MSLDDVRGVRATSTRMRKQPFIARGFARELRRARGQGHLTEQRRSVRARRVAFRGGRRLELSPKEFALLECLLAAGDRVISTEELLARVWDEDTDPFTTTVKTTMRRLRAKLGEPPVIETIREGGYRIGAQQ